MLKDFLSLAQSTLHTTVVAGRPELSDSVDLVNVGDDDERLSLEVSSVFYVGSLKGKLTEKKVDSILKKVGISGYDIHEVNEEVFVIAGLGEETDGVELVVQKSDGEIAISLTVQVYSPTLEDLKEVSSEDQKSYMEEELKSICEKIESDYESVSNLICKAA